MEPLKPEEKDAILANNPQASPAEVEEYEQLLAARFTRDPSLAPQPGPKAASETGESRLDELYRKLFRAEGAPGPEEVPG